MVYNKTPIVEAVVEIRFASSAKPELLDKLRRKYGKRYPHFSPTLDVEVEVDTNNLGVPKVNKTDGFKLNNDDATDILLLKPRGIATCRMAPYTQWEGLYDRVQQDLETWLGSTNTPTKVARIGVRFVNRIDVPVQRDKLPLIEDYVRLHISTPDPKMPVNVYALQIQSPVKDKEGWLMNVNSALVPAPLIDHMSVLLDIDIGIGNPPQNLKQIMEALAEVRSVKNKAFEEFITDKARELFR